MVGYPNVNKSQFLVGWGNKKDRRSLSLLGGPMLLCRKSLSRWEYVFTLEIADDGNASAHADEPAFENVLLALLAVALTFFGLEPRAVNETLHDDPLVARDVDDGLTRLGLGMSALDDRQVAIVSPLAILVGVGVVSAIHTIRAVDLVLLAGVSVDEVLVPTDAVVPADGIP